jgi:hypothetical protein
MKRILTLVLFTGLVVCVSPIARGAEDSKDKSAQAPRPAGKPRQMPFRGKVSAVDKSAKTITLEGKENGRTFQITSGTKITKDGKPAVLDDVKVGQSVGGLAKESAAGKWEAATLNLGMKAGGAKRDSKKSDK